jgi:phospholipid-binding lipoprotein MlaA
MKSRFRLGVLSCLCGLLTACASAPQHHSVSSLSDPFEPVNRKIFAFNEAVDKAVLRPVAKGYQKLVPEPMRIGIRNIFANVGDAWSFANNVLQAKPVEATEDFMRVSINTVLGIGGLLDIATPAGLPRHNEDFGQTLGAWGVKPGPYIVLPILGPSNARDSVGFLVDRSANPLTYLDPMALRNSVTGLKVVDTRAQLLDTSSLLEAAALDPYSFVRDAYLQRRRYQVYDGDPPELPRQRDEDEAR